MTILVKRGTSASFSAVDLGTRDISKCTDEGNDCCASADWGEAQTCRDGYRPIPVTQDQCWSIHEGCAEYEGGKGCYGCFPPEGHNASGACLSCLFETLHLLKLSRLNLWIQSRYSRPEIQDHREVLRKEYKSEIETITPETGGRSGFCSRCSLRKLG